MTVVWPAGGGHFDLAREDPLLPSLYGHSEGGQPTVGAGAEGGNPPGVRQRRGCGRARRLSSPGRGARGLRPRSWHLLPSRAPALGRGAPGNSRSRGRPAQRGRSDRVRGMGTVSRGPQTRDRRQIPPGNPALHSKSASPRQIAAMSAMCPGACSARPAAWRRCSSPSTSAISSMRREQLQPPAD